MTEEDREWVTKLVAPSGHGDLRARLKDPDPGPYQNMKYQNPEHCLKGARAIIRSSLS
jgi:hypothetical protein